MTKFRIIVGSNRDRSDLLCETDSNIITTPSYMRSPLSPLWLIADTLMDTMYSPINESTDRGPA